MRLITTLFISLCISSSVYAKSWKISTNGKTMLKANIENEEKNQFSLKTTPLSKKGLNLCYTEGKDQKKGWERVIAVYDATDKELKEEKGTSLQISRDSLRSYLKNSPQVKIYTWALPTDPKLKALVRVRRIHLATISQ